MLYAFLLGYLPSIFCDFGEKPIDFYLQDSLLISFLPLSAATNSCVTALRRVEASDFARLGIGYYPDTERLTPYFLYQRLRL